MAKIAKGCFFVLFYLKKMEKEILLNSFVYSNFNYCPLAWHQNRLNKISKKDRKNTRTSFSETFSVIMSRSKTNLANKQWK